MIVLRRTLVNSFALSLGASLLLGLPVDARADRGMSTNILKGLYTNHVRTTPEAGNPDLRTRTYAADASTAFENARTVAAGMSRWKIAKADPASGTIAAEARTRWMRFVDDVTITVIPGETGGSVVNVASRSRVGLGDLGVNARRVSNYLKALDKVMDAKGGM